EDAGEAVVLDGEDTADVVLAHHPHGLPQARVGSEAERCARAQQADGLADGVLVEDASDRGTGGVLEVGQLLVGDLGVHDPSVASAWATTLDADAPEHDRGRTVNAVCHRYPPAAFDPRPGHLLQPARFRLPRPEIRALVSTTTVAFYL